MFISHFFFSSFAVFTLGCYFPFLPSHSLPVLLETQAPRQAATEFVWHRVDLHYTREHMRCGVAVARCDKSLWPVPIRMGNGVKDVGAHNFAGTRGGTNWGGRGVLPNLGYFSSKMASRS